MKTIIDPTAQHFEEARILKILQHDNIIRTEEVFTSNKGKKLHIVMEHAEGKFSAFYLWVIEGTLADMIEERAKSKKYFSEEEVVSIIT